MLYKILSPTMCNRTMQYSLGVNVLKEPFRDVSEKAGGIYLCRKRDIGYWLYLYVNPIICEAVLCDDSLVSKKGRKIKTDKVILRNPLPIRDFMAKQNEDTLMDYVYDYGLALEYIENQTLDLQLFALRQNGRALQFVKDPTHALCIEALKQTGEALKYVPNQTQALCIMAVKQSGRALKHVKNQDNSIIMMAVHNSGLALKYAKNPSLYACKVAVEQNGYALQHVVTQTPEIIACAIKQNPYAKMYKKEVHNEIQEQKSSMAWFYED